MGAIETARQSIAETAVLIPVYAAPHIDPAALSVVLGDTVSGCLAQGVSPARLCLAVDGASGRTLAESVASRFGVTPVVGMQNRGKLFALRLGVDALAADLHWRALAVLDQDGDHFANDLVNLVRMADHLRAPDPGRRLLVLGERRSRHRPMGFLRGELEELADRILLDALAYRAAISDTPLQLQYALPVHEFPDFHSGFKLFDRQTALSVFTGEPRLCDVGEDAYFRHAVEAVMTVEALDAGAVLAVVNRCTLNEQPFSTFGVMDRCRLVADKLIWPLRRLQVPPPFAAQWLANHLGRLQLHTLSPQGRDELQHIASLTLDACGADPQGVNAFSHPPFV